MQTSLDYLGDLTPEIDSAGYLILVAPPLRHLTLGILRSQPLSIGLHSRFALSARRNTKVTGKADRSVTEVQASFTAFTLILSDDHDVGVVAFYATSLHLRGPGSGRESKGPPLEGPTGEDRNGAFQTVAVPSPTLPTVCDSLTNGHDGNPHVYIETDGRRASLQATVTHPPRIHLRSCQAMADTYAVESEHVHCSKEAAYSSPRLVTPHQGFTWRR
jgi:hypothetical protein